MKTEKTHTFQLVRANNVSCTQFHSFFRGFYEPVEPVSGLYLTHPVILVACDLGDSYFFDFAFKVGYRLF